MADEAKLTLILGALLVGGLYGVILIWDFYARRRDIREGEKLHAERIRRLWEGFADDGDDNGKA